MATTQNISIYAGDDVELNITVYDSAGSALDITGLSAAQWIMKRYAGSTTAEITKTLGGGVTVVSAADGTMKVSINSADSVSLTSNFYYHELRIQDSNSDYTTVMTGTVTLNPAQAFS